MNKIITVIIGVAAFLGVILGSVALVGGNQQGTNLGAATPGTRFVHGITVGSAANSPTNIGDIKSGTCALIGMNAAMTGTSSLAFDCAVTGVVSGDGVLMEFASSTPNYGNATGACFQVVSAAASSTAGYITAVVQNCGRTVIPSTVSAGSSTLYTIIKTQ